MNTPGILRSSIHTGHGPGLEKPRLSLGFIPLTDCAPLVIAQEKGYFARHGLEVELSKETSWANIRDKVSLGILDGAQMLAGMPLAIDLGLGPLQKPMTAALSLDLNGNAITVSTALYRLMHAADPEAMHQRSLSAQALKTVITRRRHENGPPLTFATVFPFSGHNYELRYWMAAAGIDPERDVRLCIIPPAQMVRELAAGNIDGYCVGEPWNTLAIRQGIGHSLISSYEIWNNRTEKVLGVTREWAEQHPRTHRALLCALLEAGQWLDDAANRLEAAELLAAGHYVNAPPSIVRLSLSGAFQYNPQELPGALPDFNVFHRYAANFPWVSHAVWLLSQMLRWGQIDQPLDLHQAAGAVYRPDIYREAATQLGLPTPAFDSKCEGTHDAAWQVQGIGGTLQLGADRFFDGRQFDPTRVFDYLNELPVNNCRVAPERLQALNPIDTNKPSLKENAS